MVREGQRQHESREQRAERSIKSREHRVPEDGEDSVVRFLGEDSKGWTIIGIIPKNPSHPPEELILSITLQDGGVKKIEFPRQRKWMEVHVNPDPLGPDEWRIDNQLYHVEPSTCSSPSGVLSRSVRRDPEEVRPTDPLSWFESVHG